MKIIINNTEFEYNIGCKIIKARDGEDCPKWFNQPDIWDDIEPITFKEIATQITNLEQRRIAINALGLENLVKEVNPKMIGSETISKTTTFVTPEGELVTHNFNDTYNLFQVSAESLGLQNSWNNTNYYYIQCKDTSTDREYLIWVDAFEVYRTNDENVRWRSSSENYGEKINPIQAIAWTFQTTIEKGGIEKIVRQGDCILLKKNSTAKIGSQRHLTEKEYRELLVLES
jgi:hypothetical protein